MSTFFRHIFLTLAALCLPAALSAQMWDMDVMADSTLRMDSTFFQNRPAELYRYYFIEAVSEQNAGHTDRAYELLNRCIALNPEAAEAYYQIADHYLDQNQDTLALHTLQRAAELQPKNHTYVERLAQVYVHLDQYDKATETYELLYADNRSRADIVEMLFRLYYVQQDADKMLEMLERMETIEGASEQISLSKMQIYAQQGKRGKQLDELKRLVSKHPNDTNYRIMMANWLLNNEKPKEAFAELKGVLKSDPTNENAQMTLLDYYRQTGENAKADLLLSQLLNSGKTTLSTKLTLLRQSIQQDQQNNRVDSAKTLALIDRVLLEKQEDASGYIFKAAYMDQFGWPKADIDSVYKQALAVEPDNAFARWNLISSYWENEDWDKMIEQGHIAQEYNPTEMLFYYAEGIGLYQKKDEDAALRTFRKGVTQIRKDSNADLASDFYAIMGDILHNKNLDTEAFAAYDSCLVYKADNIVALNNYAYYLCLKDTLLDRAAEMSRKAVDAEPENATCLDTYAWVLFMQGSYADALTYIEKALTADSTLSNVVKEHAGDIYIMNGNEEKALEYWNQALSFDKENALLQEKIKQKKYIKE